MVHVPLRMFCFKKSTAGAFVVSSDLSHFEPKKYDRRQCVDLELVALTGEKHSKPRPQNRILVHLWGSFQNLHWAPCLFYMGVPHPRGLDEEWSGSRVGDWVRCIWLKFGFKLVRDADSESWACMHDDNDSDVMQHGGRTSADRTCGLDWQHTSLILDIYFMVIWHLLTPVKCYSLI